MPNYVTTFFVLSSANRPGHSGLFPMATWSFDELIIEEAHLERDRTTGMTMDELLSLSIAKMSANGRLYQTFPTDDAGAAAFVECAKQYGIDDHARDIINEFHS